MAGLLDILLGRGQQDAAPQQAPSGGGMGNFLSGLGPAIAMLDPRNQQLGGYLMQMQQDRQDRQAGQQRQNQTIGWLQSQGMSPDEAIATAADKELLRNFIVARQNAGKPDWQISEIYDEQGRPKKVLVDKNNPQNMRDLGGSKNEQTSLMQNLAAAGLQPGTPEYQKAVLEGTRSGVNVDARNMGAIPQGYRVQYDANNNPVSMQPIPGGPADTTKTDASKAENLSTATDVITGAAEKARQAYDTATLPVTGLTGRVAGAFPSTNSAEVRRQVETLKSNAKIENLQAMRAASPTGGALGAVSDSENAMLAAKAGALDPDSPNFARDLADYERSLLRTIHGKDAGDRIFDATRQKPTTEQSSGRKTSTGVQWSID